MKQCKQTKATTPTSFSSTCDASTTQLIEISEDDFAVQFKPLPNHLNPNASFDWGDGYGTLFETYGEEFEFVRSQSYEHIWTLLSGDEEDLIVSGYHFVNRIGYFVCELPIPDGSIFEVPLLDLSV